MKKRIFIFLVAALFFMTTIVLAQQGQEGQEKAFSQQRRAKQQRHRQQQQQDDKAFAETLKGKTPKEKDAAIKPRREIIYKEDKAFNAMLHQENLEFFKSQLAKDGELTGEQKKKLVSQFEDRYRQDVSFRDQMHRDNVAFFEQIAGMTPEQKKAAIKAHREEEKIKIKEYSQQQRGKSRAEREKIVPKVKRESKPAVTVN